MNPFVRASVRFLSPVEGGRRTLPQSPIYRAVAEFEGAIDPTGAWSLVVEFDAPPDSSGEATASVHFLAPDAPHALLFGPGKFVLYEGRTPVARGHTLQPSAILLSPLPRPTRPATPDLTLVPLLTDQAPRVDSW